MDNYKVAKKVSIITIIGNIILSIAKISAGFIAKSSAMLADGVHTVSDVFTTILVLVGIKISSKKADNDHPYGHERFESVFAKLLSIILVITGFLIGYEAIKTLLSKSYVQPGKLALYASFISIISKELMFRYTYKSAKEIKSTSMEADAWHHRSDVYSSLGTFVGIFGARMGFPALDPLAGIIVSILIVKVGVDLYLQAVNQLVDQSASKDIIERIENKTLEIEGVVCINQLRTRTSGSIIFVDMDIAVDGNITVEEGHRIAEKVHDELESNIEDIKHCMIHVEPKCIEKRTI